MAITYQWRAEFSNDEVNRLHAEAFDTRVFDESAWNWRDARGRGVGARMPAGSLAHFANHSCDPTLWHVGPFEVATRRAVGADEELTIDYATNSGDASFTMDCTCGAMLCRRIITAQDWHRPELQERYAGHWIPSLAELIGASH